MIVLKAIIFDLDDTLYDEMQFVKGGFWAVSLYLSENYNINQKIIYRLLSDILRKHGRGHIFDIALENLKLYSEKLIPKLIRIYREHKSNLSLYPKARRILYILKKKYNYKLGLITDGDFKVQKNKVDTLKISNLFDYITFSDKYNTQKPDLYLYKKTLEKLTTNPRESIYIGDNPYKDFIGAKKLGIHTIRIMEGRYKNINLHKEYEADFRIRILGDIFSIIKILQNK